MRRNMSVNTNVLAARVRLRMVRRLPLKNKNG